MTRKFQKGLAIFLILCLLVNGAAGHELSVSPELLTAFEACASMGDVLPPRAVYWHPVNNTSEDILISGNYIRMQSLSVSYDWEHHVYDCHRWSLLYYADYDVWFDIIDNVYFALSGDIYIRSSSPTMRKGICTQMDALALGEYKDAVFQARDDIKKFQREMTQKMLHNVLPQVVRQDERFYEWELPR